MSRNGGEALAVMIGLVLAVQGCGATEQDPSEKQKGSLTRAQEQQPVQKSKYEESAPDGRDSDLEWSVGETRIIEYESFLGEGPASWRRWR